MKHTGNNSMEKSCALPPSIYETLSWKLLGGSHEFPGPEGGTCINEAAIIAAGFEYKAVQSWRDCPPCFSPVVSEFAICLNDALSNKNRHILLPFVTLIAGTRKDARTEKRRVEWLVLQVVNVEIAGLLVMSDNPMLAREASKCADVASAKKIAESAREWFRALKRPAYAAADAAAAAAAYAAAAADAYAAAYAAADAYAAAYAAADADAYAYAYAYAYADADAYADAAARQKWLTTRGIELLDGLIKFSPPDSIIDLAVAESRLWAAKTPKEAALAA